VIAALGVGEAVAVLAVVIARMTTAVAFCETDMRGSVATRHSFRSPSALALKFRSCAWPDQGCAFATSTAYTWFAPCMFERNTSHLSSGVKLTFGSRR